jgi:hypothetical protein
MKKLLLFLTMAGFIVACMPQVPPSPQVQVVVTVINADEGLIEGAVAQALTGTASSSVALTETALAVAGVTLTPTSTSTATATPLPPTATAYFTDTLADTIHYPLSIQYAIK